MALVALLANLALAQDPRAPKPSTGSVSGRVLDALGEPVPLAEVEFGVHGQPPLGKTDTDGTGMFTVSGLPLSVTNYVVFSATAPGRTRQRSYVQVTPANPESTVVVRLWDAVSLRGRAVDAEGQPVVGAVVTAAYDELRSRTLDPSGETITDGDGRFVLERVPLGYITVQAWAPGYVMHTRRTWLRDAAELELVMERGAEESLSVRIEGLPDGVTAVCSVVPWDSGSRRAWPRLLREVRGTQWQRSGWPPVCYKVAPRADGFVFDPAEAVTESDGPNRLVFGARPKSTDRLTVAGKLGGDAEVAAPTYAVGRFTVVSSLGSVGGVVRDLQGQPVPGARVWLHDCSGRGTDDNVREVLTDRNGRFRHVGVDPGRHLLWLQPASGRATAVGGMLWGPFEVEAGGHVERELSGDLGG